MVFYNPLTLCRDKIVVESMSVAVNRDRGEDQTQEEADKRRVCWVLLSSCVDYKWRTLSGSVEAI